VSRSATSDPRGERGDVVKRLRETASPTIYGWIVEWDTTGVPNGTPMLHRVNTETNGTTAVSPGITVTVSN
jgi:hypothetical protein